MVNYIPIILYLVLVADILAWLVVFFINKKNIGRLPRFPEVKPDEKPLVSIIIPARNEELLIAKSLQSLFKQDYQNFEIIVVNDHSTDNTGKILSDFSEKNSNLKVVTNPDLPAGWLGKNNAMQKGYEKSRGELILFSDADVVHAVGSLSAAVAKLQQDKLGMLSLLPKFICKGFWENVIMPSIYFLAAPFMPLSQASDPAKSSYGGIGAFMLVSREAYLAVGKHEKIKAEVMDDHELGRIIKSAGFRLGIFDGSKLLRIRMYRNFKDVYAGFLKNTSAFMGNSLGVIIRNFSVYFCMYVAWLVVLCVALFYLPTGSNRVIIILSSITTFFVIAIVLSWVKKFFSVRWWAPLSFMLGGLLILVLTIHSSYLSLFKKKSRWRGRDVKLQ